MSLGDEPAFPRPCSVGSIPAQEGMSVRTYATIEMMKELASQWFPQWIASPPVGRSSIIIAAEEAGEEDYELVARVAEVLVDALLARLEIRLTNKGAK